ncbi:MAG: hypothetical protein Q9M89_10010 [Persephonella sp.]|nr:hypothetical protein [Persephonella sp.]
MERQRNRQNQLIKEAEKEARLRAREIENEAAQLKKEQELIIEKEVLKRKKQLEEELKREKEEPKILKRH